LYSRDDKVYIQSINVTLLMHMADNEKNSKTDSANGGNSKFPFDDTVLAISVIVFLIIMFIGLCGYFQIILLRA